VSREDLRVEGKGFTLKGALDQQFISHCGSSVATPKKLLVNLSLVAFADSHVSLPESMGAGFSSY